MDCAEGHFSETFVTACSEPHYLMRSIFEANIPGLWGAYHFVERLVSWLTIHDTEVFDTPGLAACFIKKRFGDPVAAKSMTSPTTVKASQDIDPCYCTKANKKLKNSLNNVTENKNFPWQPAVRPWWEQHHQELLAQVAIILVVASDDFDEYVRTVAESPDVPDTSKDASYFAAQKIYQAVNDSKIYGQWGAYHLVSRVSKWMMVNPDDVKEWKKACSELSSQELDCPVRTVLPSNPGELDLVLGGHLNRSSLLRQPNTSNAAPARSFALWNLVFDVFR